MSKEVEVEVSSQVEADGSPIPSIEPDWSGCEVESVRKTAQELYEALMGVGTFELRITSSYSSLTMIAHKTRGIGAFYIGSKKITWVSTRLEAENDRKKAIYDRRFMISEGNTKEFTAKECKRIVRLSVDYAKSRWG